MQQQLNIDPSKLPTMKCIRCDNFTFNASFVVKRISALISPSGKETAAPIQVFTCVACGTILPMGGDNSLDFLGDIRDEQTNQQEPEQKPSTLIMP